MNSQNVSLSDEQVNGEQLTYVKMENYFDRPRFYTDPPKLVQYDYSLYPVSLVDEFAKKPYKHGIVDTGVSILFKPPHEYPKGYYKKWESIDIPRTWKVIPDYVAGSYAEDKTEVKLYDNVDRTFENIQKYYVKDTNLVPVIQHRLVKGRKKNKDLLDNTIRRFQKEIDTTPDVLFSVAKIFPDYFVNYSFSALRKAFPDTWLHALGITAGNVPRVAHIIDSWDTRSWGFARGTKRRKMLASKGVIKKFFVDDGEERQFFIDFLQRMGEYHNEERRTRSDQLSSII